MNKKRVRVFFLSVVVVASLFFLLERNFLPGSSAESSSAKDFKLIGKIINLIKNHYFKEPQPSETMEGAFKGLVNSLDTISSYLDRESALKYKIQRIKRLNEPGIILYKKRYTFYPQVIGILKNSPAEKEGIKLGELIIAIDDKSTRTMSMLEANLRLKEREEKNVALRIIRKGKTQEISIGRKAIFEEPFSYIKHNGTSGILRIHYLYPPCVIKIKEKILPRIKLQEKPLIIDLRNCAEGEMEEALKLANLFLKEKEVGYFVRREETKEVLSCEEEPELAKLKTFIWINQATLGPAEAVAAVLKEFKEAKTIGFPTPGLVAKQDYFTLEDGSGLLLTSGIFALKSGKRLWETGLKPDIKINNEYLNDDSYLTETVKLLR